MLLPASLTSRLHARSRHHRWHRLLRRHRRGVTAGLVLLSLLCALESLSPAARPTAPAVVAAGDLSAGHTLDAADLRLARLPPADRPAGLLTDPAQALGQVLAAPVRRGEPLTDVRLVGPRLVDALGPGLVAVPVRLADGATVALVQPGDRVDLIAAPVDERGARASVVAEAVRVLTVPAPADDGGSQGALVVVATTARVALALAAASTVERLSLSLLPG
jgi:pilus assembly protein CpaB